MRCSNLGKRLFFALWAAPLGWWAVNSTWAVLPRAITAHLFSNPSIPLLPGQIAAMALIVIACSEYLGMLSIAYPRNGFWIVYFWLVLQMLSSFEPKFSLTLRFDIFILLLVTAAESIIWGKNSGRWKRASLLFSGTVFLSISAYSLINLYQPPFQTIFNSRFSLADGSNPTWTSAMISQLGIVTILAAIFICDSTAYLVGSLWGRHHFSSISPRKTIEGSVAGFVSAIAVSIAGWSFFSGRPFPSALLFGLSTGIIIGISAQLGDFLVSLIKRYFHVKDASNIIPGHGGILDRFDSMFFTAPVLNLFFVIVLYITG